MRCVCSSQRAFKSRDAVVSGLVNPWLTPTLSRHVGYLFYEKLPQKYSCTIVRNGRLDGLFHKEDVT